MRSFTINHYSFKRAWISFWILFFWNFITHFADCILINILPFTRFLLLFYLSTYFVIKNCDFQKIKISNSWNCFLVNFATLLSYNLFCSFYLLFPHFNFVLLYNNVIKNYICKLILPLNFQRWQEADEK